jgi:predicted ATPase/DNA-binding winged helix-turn-helix (wHTH) protein
VTDLRLALDDGVLDLRVGVIERGDERVRLTTRELELLRYLVARDGEPASREQLLLDVWEYAPGVESRTVDTTVKRLRRKLEVLPTKPNHLVSVHGVGYRFVPGAVRPPSVEPPLVPLPRDPDRFVGRRDELAAVEAALRSNARLVTLRGPGGVGTSRLAREVARARAEAGDAVIPVDLSHAVLVDDVRAELGSALGLPASADDQELLEALAARVPALVLLDEVDRARSGLGELLGPLVRGAPSATFLATARQALELPFEVEIRLEPLPAAEAMELFRSRAGSGDDADAETLERLVEALDRLPLALELAAARAAVLSPAEILDRLDQRFRLLATRAGPGGRPQRLRDTILWAWEALDEHERAALAVCSVFQGGFGLEAAETVAGPLLPDAWVIDLVDALEARSLLHRREAAGRSRFSLLESVRTFAAQEADPELLAAARREHLRWALALGRKLEAATNGPGVKPAIAGLVAERANLRAAWTSASAGLDRAELAGIVGRLQERTGSARVGLEIVEATLADGEELSALRRADLLYTRALLRRALNDLDGAMADAEAAAGVVRSGGEHADDEACAVLAGAIGLRADLETDVGKSAEALERIEAALAELPVRSAPWRLRLLHRKGGLLFHLGRLDEAAQQADELFVQARDVGYLLAEGDARRLQAAVALRGSRIEVAWEKSTAARQLFADAGEPVREAGALEVMSVVRSFERRFADAAECLRPAVQIYRRLGRRNELPRALSNLARVLLHSGQEAEARAVAEDAMAVARSRGALRQEMEARTLAGTVALAEGRSDDALACYERSIEDARAASLKVQVGIGSELVAIARLARGELDPARRMNDEAVRIYEEVGDLLGLAHHLATGAAIEAQAGDPDAAEALLDRARRTGPDRGRPEAWLRLCRGFVCLARGDEAGVAEALAEPTTNAFERVMNQRLRVLARS